jgi:hypothetical protein
MQLEHKVDNTPQFSDEANNGGDISPPSFIFSRLSPSLNVRKTLVFNFTELNNFYWKHSWAVVD